MLEKVKLALRIVGTEFDSELTDLIAAAEADLAVAGVTNVVETDPLIRTAVITYVKARFGEPDEYDRLKASYDEQKAQLSTNTGHTDWGLE
ncbi:MAG: DNA-packaging protein [Clostridia bacterium]|nr:DNA-packaging protein [Clostridia bacterium]